MNRYNNTFGYHTPKFSEKLFNIINTSTNVQWEDTSWHNDTCDSIQYDILEREKWISIMLPNSIVDDASKELVNYFYVTDENEDEILLTTDIYEVIDFVNAMLPNEDYPELLDHQKLN